MDFHLRYMYDKPEPPSDLHTGKLPRRKFLYIIQLLSWNIVLMLWHFAVSDVLGWGAFSQDLYILANRRSLVGVIYCCAFVYKKQLPMPKWIVMVQMELLCCRMWRFTDEFIGCQVILSATWGYDLTARNQTFNVSLWYTGDWEPLTYLLVM